jgi:signal transduction histidine kinase
VKITLERNDTNAIITISDNGGGIPDDVLPKIFDPYFTTKHKSQGTGLGLYMSKEIIVKHLNGKIEASNNDVGAVFTITLPLG